MQRFPLWCFRFGMVSCICIAQTHLACASNAHIRTSLPQESIVFATPFELVVEVATNADAVVTFEPNGEKLGPFDILDTNTPALPTTVDNELVWRKKFVLETLQMGELTIPAIMASAHDAADETDQSLTSEPINVTVVGVIEQADQEDPSKFRGLANVEPSPSVTTPNDLNRILLGLVAGSAAFLGVWYYRRRRQPSPTDWAREQLQDLREQGSQLALTAWSDQFESTLRRWSVATEKDFREAFTTSELIAQLRDRSELPLKTMEATLKKAELIKFSGSESPHPSNGVDLADRNAAVLEALELVRVSARSETA